MLKLSCNIVKNKFSLVLGFLVISIFLSTAQAGIFGNSNSDGPKQVSEVFILKTQVIDDNKLLLRWDILDDYYLYDNKMQFSATNAVQIKEVSRSKTKSKDDPLFGKVEVYYQSSEIILQLSKLPENREVALTIQYQGCWDGGVCYPPVTENIRVTFPAAQVNEGLASDSISLDAKQSKVTAVVSNVSAKVSEQDYFNNLLLSGDFSWILIAFFIAGLALSLTPCVFPMIPILSSIIAGQGKEITKAKAFTLTLVYVLSVSFTYTLAGVLAGIFGENLQILFQTTWIIVLFSLIFFALALSMFGLYELQLPAVLQSKLTHASNQQKGGNYYGVAVMGVLSALIVGPCMAAPLAGALIYIGQTADPVLGGFALFSLSLGMGVPLILVGISAGHLMPKVGAWMNTVKAVFGVLLVFMAIYMLDRVVSIQITMLLCAITIIISAVFLGAFSPITNTAKTATKLAKGLSVIILTYGLSLLLGVLSGNGNLIQPLKGIIGSGSGAAQNQQKNEFIKVTSIDQLTPILEQAKLQAKPVMLDFYADWCISCVELEYMLEKEKVSKVLKNITLVKVDLTDYNDASKAILEKYNVLGPPALVFYDKQGKLKEAMTTVGLLSADEFLAHIQVLLEK